MKFGVEVPQERLVSANKTGVIILSRYSSTRLPGKALRKIKGKSILSYIIERVEQVIQRENIVLATSTAASDDAIAAFAEAEEVKCYRGSLENVAQRFYEAAESLGCEYACRINGDNVFLDSAILWEMIMLAETRKYRFLSNVKNRTFPKGMSVEIAEMNYYRECLPTIMAEEFYKEHVMVYLYERDGREAHFYLQNLALPEAAGIQLALDTPDDFRRTEWILNNIPEPHYKAGMAEILKLYKQYEKQV